MSGLTEKQSKLYKKLEGAIERKEQIDQILQSASENDLRAVLTAGTKYNMLEYDQSYLTLLGSVIYDSDQRNIEAILGTANDKGILKEVLTAANIHIKFSNGQERTLKPLAFAICMSNQKSIGAILDAASDKGILKEVFAGIEKDVRERIKHFLKGAENQDMLSKIDQVEKDIENEAVKANPSSNENVIPPEGEEEFVDCYESMPQPQAEANALHSAVRNDNLEEVQALLEKVANVDIKTDNGYTALHIATFNNNLEIVQALLEKGANVDIQANNGYTALHIAATRSGHFNIVQALLDKGAGINIQEANNGYTALHMAAANGHTKIVEALLKVKGIDVDARSKLAEYTPLYLAAQNDRLEIVQALLEKKADVNIQTDNNGYTALHIAAVNGCTDILKSLLPKATYPLLKDIEGNTPIDLIKDESAKAELQKLIEDLKTQDTAKPSVTKPGNQNSNTVHRVEGSAIKTAIKAGLSCGGVIFIVGVCFAAGSQTPILAIVGTAAAAVSFGLIAGIFAYAVSKPSSKVEETDARQKQEQNPFSQTV